MRHHLYNQDYKFIVEPMEFNKYSDRSILQYCLGATMYMPGTKNFAQAIIDQKYKGLTSMVMCFEDACKEEDVPAAELNAIALMDTVNAAIDDGSFDLKNLPLIFFRVRNVEQYKHFCSMLKPEHMRLITGFNFPKFNTYNGEAYYSYLRELNEKFGEILYGMPIIEDHCVAYKESRISELVGIKEILDKYEELVLNVRVGGTDFSSVFGVRRGISYTIYDIMTVRDCLMDILNVFTRDNQYTVSGPVWEYFRAEKKMRFQPLPNFDFTTSLIKHEPILNDAVDGLLRELVLDKANGFIGKTIIHPTHLNYVNGILAVTNEEYNDAVQIMHTSGGVTKSSGGNKMNEIGPHKNWAEKLYRRAQVYGVVENERSYIDLFNGVK